MADTPVVMFALHSNRDRTQRSLDDVEGWFLSQIMIHDRPGCRGPAIVELPHQSTATSAILSPLPSPIAVRVSHGFTLCQLGQVYPSLGDGVNFDPDLEVQKTYSEIRRKTKVFHNICRDASLVPICFVVKIENM